MAAEARRARFDKLFTGIVVERPAFITRGDTRGTEHIGPEDTFDGDYGRLLDRAYTTTTDRLEKPGCGKGVASPMPASWNQIASWLKQIDSLRHAA